MNRLTTRTLIASVGMTLGLPVHAQEAASGTMLEEIVVTAQRREESVQKSSLAIEVLSSEQLKGITQPTDLNTIAPSVQVGSAGNINQTFIRGVGSFVANGRSESAIAYSLDGIYLSTGTALTPMMFDIARVEILKGPQGTLYGRNATGGAVNFITNRPTLGEVSGYVGGDVGNYDLRRINGAVNLPAGETFAVRSAFQVTERDGYFSDGTGDDDTKAARIRTLWQPNDDFSVLFNVEGARMRPIGAGTSTLPVTAGDPWRGALDPLVRPQLATTKNPLPDPHFDDDLWSASTEVNWNVGIGTLTVIPAYRSEKYDSLIYTPGFSFAEEQNAKQKSFEARLGNQTDAVKWVGGVYYYDMDQEFTFTVDNNLLGQNAVIDFPSQSTTSWAVFGEATISIVDPLRIIAGVRYTEDEQKGVVNNNSLSYFTPQATPAFDPVLEFPYDFVNRVKINSDAVSWKGGLEFDVTADSMLFLTVSRGFKGGGFFQDPTGQLDTDNITFEPEQLTAWELGSRNRFLNNSLQVNLGAFYWEYEDQQVQFLGNNTLGLPAFLTANAGNSTIYGAELDVTWRITQADTLRVAGAYLHAVYDEFERIMPGFSVKPGTACSIVPTSSPGLVVSDCSDLVMQRAPKWTGSMNYEHAFDLPNGGAIIFGADAIYSGEKYLTVDYTPEGFVGDALVGNVDLAYRAPDDRWSITAWVKNVSEEEFYTGGDVSVLNPNLVFATINPPRTYGLRFNVNF